ncbi:MAG: ABC transporter permease [Porphyromonadaceae bacterium]|nr:ABC transporter permease [Porphyromonadaceae bacterium]
MIRHTFKLLWAFRRSNGWIFAELVVSFVVVWYLMDMTLHLAYNRHIPLGYDINQVYWYQELASGEASTAPDLEHLKERIKHTPGVEEVLVTQRNDLLPFSSSFNGIDCTVDSLGTTHRVHAQRKLLRGNDFFRVFDIRSAITGEPTGFDLSNRHSVLITEDLAKALFAGKNPVGQTIYTGEDAYRVSDVIPRQKNVHALLPYPAIYFQESEAEADIVTIVAIRTREDFDVEAFRRDVAYCVPLEDEGKSMEALHGITRQEILTRIVTLFFLASIALGVIGTFWFRVRKRRGEIGLRMALGASRRSLLAGMVGEGVLLLTSALPIVLLICAAIVYADLLYVPGLFGFSSHDSEYLVNRPWLRYAITSGLTYLLLAVVIALSSLIPAYMASRMQPVDSLRNE